jgi:hypothetical protein
MNGIMTPRIPSIALTVLFTLPLMAKHPADKGDHLHFAGGKGPGAGKHIVLLAGDEEYRSEEAMPMLAQLLSERHGFECTVLFSLDENGFVSPGNQKSLSHPEALDSADLIVMSLRFRNWEGEAMEKFEAALLRGTPMVALRTSTHAFRFPKDSPWAKYSFNAKADTGWEKGFGRQVLGETWVAHHGKHKVEGCRSVNEEAHRDHPILNGVGVIFAESDVYTVNPPDDITVLQRGLVTETLEPDSKPVTEKNNPPQPISWTREFKNAAGKNNMIFTTTMGAASDLDDANLRRLVVNACYWGLGLEVPEMAVVDVPASYQPTFYGFNTYKKETRPVDHIPMDASADTSRAPADTPASTMRMGTTLPAATSAPEFLEVKKNGRIAIIGAGLASRMMKFGHFETELHLRYPEEKLTIRNYADEGSTPGFRPHSGARTSLLSPVPRNITKISRPRGRPGSSRHRTNGSVILSRTRSWHFSDSTPQCVKTMTWSNLRMSCGISSGTRWGNNTTAVSPPQLALVSPTAIQDLSATHHTPKGDKQNELLASTTQAMREVAEEAGILFIDAFAPSKKLFDSAPQPLTVDGALLNEPAYQWLSLFLANSCFGKKHASTTHQALVHSAVMEKNFTWHNLYKIPNGVHVYGRRHKPFGPENYPHEQRNWQK